MGQNASRATTLLSGPTPLSSLMEDVTPGLTAGGKFLINFDYSFLGNMPSAAAIDVIPIIDDQGNDGLCFQGAFGDLSSGQNADVLIRYEVVTVDSRFVQIGAALSGDLTAASDSYVASTQSFVGAVNTLNLSVV